jgi:hypothetical protein
MVVSSSAVETMLPPSHASDKLPYITTNLSAFVFHLQQSSKPSKISGSPQPFLSNPVPPAVNQKEVYIALN